MSLYLALQADGIRYLLGWVAFSCLFGGVLTFAGWLNSDCNRDSGRFWLLVCWLWLALFVGLLTARAFVPTTSHALRLIGAE